MAVVPGTGFGWLLQLYEIWQENFTILSNSFIKIYLSLRQS